tara:strand:- start:1029 stop:2051 length:1023 start_codon:yes stop_codon:yes gene_type:complete
MNRVLKRPMFRMGGSSNEGITSGLSSPRQNYFDAGRVLPTREEFEQAKSMYPQFEVPKGQGLSRFLMTTGLNLLSTPPQGGLLATIATASKEPTEQLFKDIDTQRATQFATDADLFKTLIEAKGEAAGGTSGKTYAKLEIASDIEKTMAEVTKLKKDLEKDPENQKLKNQLDQKEARLNYLSKENAVGKSLMQNTDFAENVLDGIIDQLKNETLPNSEELKYPEGKKDPALLKEAYRLYAEFFSAVPEVEEAKATGGRVGLQMGGEPMPMDQETAMPDKSPKIDFATLRARLPKEIGDDVVRLISASPEALEDFATIATQQDVDQFNKKYSVNLVLPQEA